MEQKRVFAISANLQIRNSAPGRAFSKIRFAPELDSRVVPRRLSGAEALKPESEVEMFASVTPSTPFL